jgi:hypothetical protein
MSRRPAILTQDEAAIERKLDLVLAGVQGTREEMRDTRQEVRDSRRTVIANAWVIFGVLGLVIGMLLHF